MSEYKPIEKTEEYPFFDFFKKQLITRDDNEPYLYRNTILRISKWFSIKIHKIVLSDDACLHDHPWPFLSIILSGGYWEWSIMKRYAKPWEYRSPDIMQAPDGRYMERKWYKPGSILYRPASYAHKLELPLDKNGNPIPCKTFVITGKVIRKWGFFTPTGWIYWRKYSRKENC